MTPKTEVQQPGSETTEESAEQRKERTYAALCENKELAFDPMQDLNLPSSYDEVALRFKRLQASRDMEILN